MNYIDSMHVVIIGGLHHNTLGVIRSIGEAGIPKDNIFILLVGDNINQNNFVFKSKYVEYSNASYVNKYDDVIPWLRDNSKDGIKKAVICCSDGTAEVVMRHSAELEEYFWIPSVLLDVSKLMEKDYQDELAESCGLDIPTGIVISKNQEIDWNCFPCITKPIKSIAGAGKSDIQVSNDKDELDSVLKTTKANYVQIQRYVDKKMEYQLIGCSLDGGNKVIIPGYTQIIRQPRNTNTGYLQYCPILDFEYNSAAVHAFLKKIGYSGLFSIEFVRGKDDKDYFLEINMRNDGNAYCVKSAGINLPFLWCYYCHYNEIPEMNLTVRKPVYFIPDFYDVKIGIKTVGLIEWVRQFFTAESHSLYHKNDMGPFLFEFKRYVLKVIRRVIKY